MYTNLDGYNNKRNELLTRIAEKKPDVIGLTEIMEKRASSMEVDAGGSHITGVLSVPEPNRERSSTIH
jgi:hypothetical protein